MYTGLRTGGLACTIRKLDGSAARLGEEFDLRPVLARSPADPPSLYLPETGSSRTCVCSRKAAHVRAHTARDPTPSNSLSRLW
ncbi:UNVERIFIED_CONTAM: hypothetical protein Sangu_2733100 [Sesamum angustifolium]|uniref:Uncharacterized protein n=1 Tax=Sesamum angustifolium TaxID=2727405 RepID=A0AAW2IVV7_9LAMI